MLQGIGPATLKNIARVANFEAKDLSLLAKEIPRLQKALEVSDWAGALEKSEEQVYIASNNECRIISSLDEDYPQLLAETKDDPFIIWTKGTLATKQEKSIAIIGTREPTEHGKIITQRITSYFVAEEYSIVSGLALGCDSLAHEAAVTAGGHTVAVLAHGLHTIAPAKNRGLAEKILNSGGLLVSQFPMGVEAIPQQFVQRDKTQAGLAKGVVMVQSGLNGGSLHASRAALDYGRWLAVPYPTKQDLSRDEQKIQANILLADGSDDKKLELLKLKDEKKISGLIILRGKEDYMKCFSACGQQGLNLVKSQSDLI